MKSLYHTSTVAVAIVMAAAFLLVISAMSAGGATGASDRRSALASQAGPASRPQLIPVGFADQSLFVEVKSNSGKRAAKRAARKAKKAAKKLDQDPVD